MKKSFLFFIPYILFVTSCGNSHSSVIGDEEKTPEALKMELGDQEKREPLTYLTIDAKMQDDEIKTRDAGLFRDAEYSPDGNTIYGTIKNTATIAKFKDIVVTVTFYSQTETAIETKDYIIYEFYEPNTTSQFNLKVDPPVTMAKFGIEIKNATAVD